MNLENFNRLRDQVRADPTRSKAVREYVRELEHSITDYENGITWQTTCLNCARMIDQCYALHSDYGDVKRELKQMKQSASPLITCEPGNLCGWCSGKMQS